MRIRAGRLKGRTLSYPRSGLRPTKDITRQALFNILGACVRDADVCDLYAGGGALGIEALSRGARTAVFVEQNPAVLRYLRGNTRELEGTTVVRGDVLKTARRLKKPFDIVIADPPYRNDLVQATLDCVAQNGLVKPGGWMVIEHHRLEQPCPPRGWEMARQGQYGDSWLSVMRRQDEDEA